MSPDLWHRQLVSLHARACKILKEKSSITIEDVVKTVIGLTDDESIIVMIKAIRKAWASCINWDKHSPENLKLKRNQEAGGLVCTVNDYLP